MDRIIAVSALILHLLCCVLVCIGIELKILKLKRYMIPFIVFVPVSGLICCLILHFQIFMGRNNQKDPDVDRLKNNEEIYRSIAADHTEVQKEIIPLEEALIVNDAKLRRNLIMDVLNDHPEKYLDVLLRARMNDDVEVVHYATTSMAEFSKVYDDRFRELDRKRNEDPENDQILEEFCDFLKGYLKQGIAEGKLERERRESYSVLLEQRLKHAKTFALCTELAGNELDLKRYDKVAVLLEYMGDQWQNEEEYQMLLLRYYAETKQGEKLKEQIAYIDKSEIYITQKNREKMKFWR